MGDISEILAAFGFTPDIALAVTRAVADPTSENVNAVVAAYAANGQVIPGKLAAYLVELNEERYPQDTVRGSAFPWVVFGVGVIAFLFFRKR